MKKFLHVCAKCYLKKKKKRGARTKSWNTGTFRVQRGRKDWKEITQDIKGDLVEIV